MAPSLSLLLIQFMDEFLWLIHHHHLFAQYAEMNSKWALKFSAE